jgi:hypothetical protein
MNFTTKQGKHYSNKLLYKLLHWINLKDVLAFQVKFTQTCQYSLPEEDQKDINKLFGFSTGMHHNNSARFGWCYDPNIRKINLYAYCYIDGKRKSKFITSVEIGQNYQLYIHDLGTSYEFVVDEKYTPIATTKIRKSAKRGFGYKLWPFFGGNNPAPHDIIILMKRLQ